MDFVNAVPVFIEGLLHQKFRQLDGRVGNDDSFDAVLSSTLGCLSEPNRAEASTLWSVDIPSTAVTGQGVDDVKLQVMIILLII